jgi:glycine cleavage system H protein
LSVPAELQYTSEHEWVSIAGGVATIGITAYAAESLGDIVFVELPQVGAAVTAGETCGEVESTKSVSDLYAPVTGSVTEVNQGAVDDPEQVGTEPYGAGWLFKVELDGDTPDLLSADDYTRLTEGES